MTTTESDAEADQLHGAAVLPGRWPIRHLTRWQVAALGQAGWVSASFGGQQVLRLLTNVALARLLAPELLGTMLIVNTLRTGGELLSDVGVGQSIVNNPEGDRPAFYNTAWTIQIARGLLLFLVALIVTVPISRFYGGAQLTAILPVAALIFVITGFTSPSLFLLQKSSQIPRLALFELAVAAASAVVHVALALYSPTIWALIAGLLLSNVIATAGSFLLVDGTRHRLQLDRVSSGQILGFGKWVFLSTLIYFLAMNFDRLYFAKAIPFALLGVYGVARTYADAATQLFQKATYLIIFPRVSASGLDGARLRGVIAGPRSLLLLGVAILLAGGATLSDAVIGWLYDERYGSAAVMLPIMLAGVWFAILSSISDSLMLGIGRPAYVATANAAKLVWIVVALPLALAGYGLFGALLAFTLGDAVRYIALAALKRGQGLSFIRQDLAYTALFFGLVVAMRVTVANFGLGADFAQLWQAGVNLSA